MTDNIKKARRIALRSLRACYGPEGIYAGLHQFKDYWARDSFFACIGALSVEDKDIVVRTLYTFAKAQNKEGVIPLRIGARHMILKLFGIDQPKSEIFGEDKEGNTTIDGTCLFIITAASLDLIDKKSAKTLLSNLSKACAWIISQLREGLISEEYFAGWNDSIQKRGYVLYTHVVAYKALNEFANIAKRHGISDKGALKSAKSIKRSCQIFWNGRYFIDAIEGKKRLEQLPFAENSMAIVWKLATKKQARSILASFPKTLELRFPAYPQYPKKLWYRPLRIFGMGDYHSRLVWLWTNAAEALALSAIGSTEDAKKIVNRIANQIVRYNEVYEVYNSNGKPLRRIFYSSERPFAWNAAFFLIATQQMV